MSSLDIHEVYVYTSLIYIAWVGVVDLCKCLRCIYPHTYYGAGRGEWGEAMHIYTHSCLYTHRQYTASHLAIIPRGTHESPARYIECGAQYITCGTRCILTAAHEPIRRRPPRGIYPAADAYCLRSGFMV